MRVSNAFETTTRAKHKVYRIYVDKDFILSSLEQGNTQIAIDILTPLVVYNKVGKNGKPYRALNYTLWARNPNVEAEATVPAGSMSLTGTIPQVA